MSDDKGDNNTGQSAESAPANGSRTSTAPPTGASNPPSSGTATPEQLSDLMKAGAADDRSSPATRRARDLDAEALRAAEQALAEGERALAAARAQLQDEHGAEPAPRARGSRRREVLLRCLLAVNVVAMLVVASLPTPHVVDVATAKPQPAPSGVEPRPAPGAEAPRFNEPWNRAMQAAEDRDFGTAVAILEGYLAANPRMAPSQQLSVLMALSHYTARVGTSESLKKSQDYQRRADAIDKSHSLPEDLVAMATAAADNGDQEALRRIWARFLLQQRQIPSWLYKHVAEAYLQLGDSYRQDAAAAAEQARRRELEDLATRLRAEALQAQEKQR